MGRREDDTVRYELAGTDPIAAARLAKEKLAGPFERNGSRVARDPGIALPQILRLGAGMGTCPTGRNGRSLLDLAGINLRRRQKSRANHPGVVPACGSLTVGRSPL